MKSKFDIIGKEPNYINNVASGNFIQQNVDIDFVNGETRICLHFEENFVRVALTRKNFSRIYMLMAHEFAELIEQKFCLFRSVMQVKSTALAQSVTGKFEVLHVGEIVIFSHRHPIYKQNSWYESEYGMIEAESENFEFVGEL